MLGALPLSVTPTEQERSTKRLSWRNLELAAWALHRDGLVVIEDAVDHAKLDFLNEKMAKDALVLQSAGDKSPYNYNKGSVSQSSIHFSVPMYAFQKHPTRCANDEQILRAEYIPQLVRYPSYFQYPRSST